MVKLRCYYSVYDSGEHESQTVTGKDLKDALLNLCDNMQVYISSDEVAEREADGEEVDAQKIIDELKESNGDGCDYIFKLENVTTGETYISNEVEEDEIHEKDVEKMLDRLVPRWTQFAEIYNEEELLPQTWAFKYYYAVATKDNELYIVGSNKPSIGEGKVLSPKDFNTQEYYDPENDDYATYRYDIAMYDIMSDEIDWDDFDDLDSDSLEPGYKLFGAKDMDDYIIKHPEVSSKNIKEDYEDEMTEESMNDTCDATIPNMKAWTEIYKKDVIHIYIPKEFAFKYYCAVVTDDNELYVIGFDDAAEKGEILTPKYYNDVYEYDINMSDLISYGLDYRYFSKDVNEDNIEVGYKLFGANDLDDYCKKHPEEVPNDEKEITGIDTTSALKNLNKEEEDSDSPYVEARIMTYIDNDKDEDEFINSAKELHIQATVIDRDDTSTTFNIGGKLYDVQDLLNKFNISSWQVKYRN